MKRTDQPYTTYLHRACATMFKGVAGPFFSLDPLLLASLEAITSKRPAVDLSLTVMFCSIKNLASVCFVYPY